MPRRCTLTISLPLDYVTALRADSLSASVVVQLALESYWVGLPGRVVPASVSQQPAPAPTPTPATAPAAVAAVQPDSYIDGAYIDADGVEHRHDWEDPDYVYDYLSFGEALPSHVQVQPEVVARLAEYGMMVDPVTRMRVQIPPRGANIDPLERLKAEVDEYAAQWRAAHPEQVRRA